MKILFIQHEKVADPGWAGVWAQTRGYETSRVHLYDGQSLPETEDSALVVLLGGEPNVDQEAQFPWLKGEKRWLEKCLQKEIPIFGICLGGQLLAHVMGAKVGLIDSPEIGWWDISAIDPTQMPGDLKNFCAFHWHMQGFETPHGALPLWTSQHWPQQGFKYKNNVIGLQFHPEVDSRLVKAFLAGLTAYDLDPSNLKIGIQTPQSILSQLHFAEAQKSVCFSIMDYWVQNIVLKTCEKATFGAGCFWGVEELFAKAEGVLSTAVGFMGGSLENPTYEDVCSEETGHAEVVHLEFDPQRVSFEELLRVFWKNHDPTTLHRQGPDIGTQYRSAVFYHSETQRKIAEKLKIELDASGKFRSPIVTEVTPAQNFFRAEDYHQRYLSKRGLSSCKI